MGHLIDVPGGQTRPPAGTDDVRRRRPAEEMTVPDSRPGPRE
jgi:hypothetical protein